MKLPQHLADNIRQGIELQIKARSAANSLCIHLADRTLAGIDKYLGENPHATQAIIVSLFKGDPSTLAHTMQMAATSDLWSPCADVLCLSCRRGRITHRVGSADPSNPVDLQSMSKLLGRDTMESLSWMSKILRGTINSENSSENHREKARKALNETIPSIVLHVALIEGLQRDLAQTI